MRKKAIVIGSGISGLSISRMLSDTYQVKIVEKADKAGGLIKCDRIDGNLFHRVGGHVFNSKNKEVLNWFWQHFEIESEFLSAKRKAKILLNDKLIGYPIENFLYELPDTQVKTIVLERFSKAILGPRCITCTSAPTTQKFGILTLVKFRWSGWMENYQCLRLMK
jgi:protoporphyrinogen oxidase